MADQPKGTDPAYPPPPPAQAAYNNAGQPPPPPYGAQQPGYAQGAYPVAGHAQPVGGTVIVTQPIATTVVINRQMYRESPVNTSCPTCQTQVVTTTRYQTGTLTWVACLVLCFVGCDLGCCFIPFCINSCKDVIHSCPNCNAQIAVYNRM